MIKSILLSLLLLITSIQVSYSQVPDVIQRTVEVQCANAQTFQQLITSLHLKLIAFGQPNGMKDRVLSLWITPKNGFVVINSAKTGEENCVMANAQEANTIDKYN